MTEQEKEELRRKIEERNLRTPVNAMESAPLHCEKKHIKWIYVMVMVLLCGLAFGAGFFYSRCVSRNTVETESKQAVVENRHEEDESLPESGSQEPLKSLEAELQNIYGTSVSISNGCIHDYQIMYVTLDYQISNQLSQHGADLIGEYARNMEYDYLMWSMYDNELFVSSMLTDMRDPDNQESKTVSWLTTDDMQNGFVPSIYQSEQSWDESVPAEYSNALEKAKNYLKLMAFSYDGLFDQLKYNQFSDDAVQYAVDNCGVDWDEQAGEKAQSYMELMAFSRDDLLDQLLHDGFTQEQAEYGVRVVGY